MEKLKGFFNPRRKQPQTAYNPLGSDQSRERSGDPTLPNPPRSHPETEYSGPPSENPPPVPFFPDGVEVLYDCSEATIDICFVHGLTGIGIVLGPPMGSPHPGPRRSSRPSSGKFVYSLTATTHT